MSLLKMKLIVYIDRYKQITAVANALQLKQPTVSFHMKKMEEEWGVKLFESRTGKVLLTPHGKMLLGYASQITALYDEAMTKLSAMGELKRNRLVIGCTSSAAAYLTNTLAMSKLGAMREDTNLSISVHEQSELFARLGSGLVDLVICGESRVHADHSEYRHKAIASSPFILAASRAHPIAGASPSSLLEEIEQYELAELEDPSVASCITKWFQNENRYLRSAASFSTIELIVPTIEAFGALAILPEKLVPKREALKLMPLQGQAPEWRLFASWSRHYWNQELIERIVSLFSETDVI